MTDQALDDADYDYSTLGGESTPSKSSSSGNSSFSQHDATILMQGTLEKLRKTAARVSDVTGAAARGRRNSKDGGPDAASATSSSTASQDIRHSGPGRQVTASPIGCGAR